VLLKAVFKVKNRIKSFDLDRSFSYSNIESIAFEVGIGNQISIFPNPLQEEEFLNIEVPKSAAQLTLKIYNALGAELINTSLINNLNNQISKSLLSKGVNLVIIEDPGGIIRSEKVIR